MKNRQLPGRREALRKVLKDGIENSDAALKRLAGFGKPRHSQMQRPVLQTMTFSSGVTPEETKNLPF